MEPIHTALRQSTGLRSLRLQNHIYGCFLVMEDLASRTLRWEEGVLRGKDFAIDFERDFGWLGVRYGFFMDRGLVLEEGEAYRAAWRGRFAEIAAMEGGAAQAAADATEDELLRTLRELPDPFFVRALDTGALPQSLIERALRLLEGREEAKAAVAAVAAVAAAEKGAAVEKDEAAEPAPTRLTQAIPEKPLRQRVLSHTYRHHERSTDPRPRVRFTRRAHGTRK
jgi:hypothetical protein